VHGKRRKGKTTTQPPLDVKASSHHVTLYVGGGSKQPPFSLDKYISCSRAVRPTNQNELVQFIRTNHIYAIDGIKMRINIYVVAYA
jgi:hypothetical protein